MDAACILGGLAAGMALVILLQAILEATVVQPGHVPPGSLEAANAVPNRARKGDRLDAAAFKDRFPQMSFAPSDASSPRRDGPGRMLFWTDPTTNTTVVPKGIILSESTGRENVDPRSAKTLNDPEEELPSPRKVIGCDPLASPIVDPRLAQFAGRCLVQVDRAKDRA